MDKLNTEPRLSDWEKIKENTNPEGEVLCIKCETAYLTEEIRDIKVSEGYTEPKLVPLESFFCDVCDFILIENEEVKYMRDYLNK